MQLKSILVSRDFNVVVVPSSILYATGLAEKYLGLLSRPILNFVCDFLACASGDSSLVRVRSSGHKVKKEKYSLPFLAKLFQPIASLLN